MGDIVIPKWPVVIFTSYRTGSTAFSFYLKQQNTGTMFFNEPAYKGGTELENFTKVFNNSNNYIIKVMGDTIVEPSWPVPQHPDYMIKKMLSDEFYKIKLCRKDKLKQIASYYIARIRDQWGYYGDITNSESHGSIELDLQKIKRAITIIKYNNEVIKNIDTDLTLYYEDLEEFDTRSKITPKPSNYNTLIDAIAQLYPTI